MHTLEDGVLGLPAPQPTATPARALAGRLRARLTLALAAAGASGLLAPALVASCHHAGKVNMRVDRVHVLAPKSADFATVFVDAALQHQDWTPHRVVVHSAKCGARVHAGDVFVDVPEIQYHSHAQISFPAKVQVIAAGSTAPAPECHIDSTVDLFGLGLFKVQRTTIKSFPVAGVTPRMWIQREGPMVRTWPSLKDPNIAVEQAGLLTMHVEADHLPQSLHDVLGSATMSLDASITYEEMEERSVRLTKTVNASLSTESDGNGGYLISVPVSMSGQVRPAPFAVTMGKMLVGRSRAYSGAPPLNHTSIDRSMRLVAEDPWSPAARSLGDSHVIGWRSHGGSVVNDLWYHVRRRLARKLSRSLVNAAGQEPDLPLLHQGRRMAHDDYVVILEETLYFDDDALTITAEFEATDAGWDFETNIQFSDTSLGSLKVGVKEGEGFYLLLDSPEGGLGNLQVDVKEGEGFYLLLDAPEGSGVEIKITDDGESTSSMLARIFDEDGMDYASLNFYDDGALMNASAYVTNSELDRSSLFEFFATEDSSSDDYQEGHMSLTTYTDSGKPTLEVTGTTTKSVNSFGPDMEYTSLMLTTYDDETGYVLEEMNATVSRRTTDEFPVPVDYESTFIMNTFDLYGSPVSEWVATSHGGIEGAEFQTYMSATVSMDAGTLMNVSFSGSLMPYDFSTFYGSLMFSTTDVESGETLMAFDVGVASSEASLEGALTSNFSMMDYGAFNFFDDGAMLSVSAYIPDVGDFSLYSDPNSSSSLTLNTYDEDGVSLELSFHGAVDGDEYKTDFSLTATPDLGTLVNMSSSGAMMLTDMSPLYGSFMLTTADAESGYQLLDLSSQGAMADDMTYATVELDTFDEDTGLMSMAFSSMASMSDNGTGATISLKTFDGDSGDIMSEFDAFLMDGVDEYSIGANISAEDQTLVDLHLWGATTGSETESTFYLDTFELDSGEPDLQVTMYIMDHEGVPGGFWAEGSALQGGSTDLVLRANGTHADGAYSVTFVVLDGDSDQQFKLDPLVITYTGNMSVFVAAFDNANDEIGTAEVAFTEGPGEMDLDIAGSFQIGSSYLQDDLDEFPCLQGSCSLEFSVNDQILEAGFQSSMPDASPTYSVSLTMIASEAELSSEASVDFGVSTWLRDGMSGYECQKFTARHPGHGIRGDLGWAVSWTVEDEADSFVENVTIEFQWENETVFSSFVSLAETAPADMTTMLESTGGIFIMEESIVEWSVSGTESDDMVSLMGEVYTDSELFARWDVAFLDSDDDDTHLQEMFGEVYANNTLVQWDVGMENTGDDNYTTWGEVIYEDEMMVQWDISETIYESESFSSQGTTGDLGFLGMESIVAWDGALVQATKCTDCSQTSLFANVFRDGDVLIAIEASYGYNETTTNVEFDVSNEDGMNLYMTGNMAENDSTGIYAAVANVGYQQDDDSEPVSFDINLHTTDVEQEMMQELSVTNSEGIPVLEYRAALDTMNCLFSDFKAEDEEETVFFLSLNATSGSGSFSLQGDIDLLGMEVPIDVPGVSTSDFLGGEGDVGGAVVSWGLSKADGLLCELLRGNFSPLEYFFNISLGEDGDSIEAFVGGSYSQDLDSDNDAWTFFGDLVDQGLPMGRVEAGVDGTAVYATVWMDSTFMDEEKDHTDTGEVLGLYAHANLSISELEGDSNSSQAWEITYIQTETFIASTNVTWEIWEPELDLSPNFAIESVFKVRDEDTDKWSTIYNYNMVGGTPDYALQNWPDEDDDSTPESPTPTPPPTYEPTPMPTVLPVYAMIHEGGMCKQGTWVDVDHKDHCALMCEAHDTCVYFSYSDSDGKCKLNDDCDINDHMNDYNVYMIGATPSPTAAPTPAPPPTYEPTPMPTPLPVYAMIHEGGLCKQGTWVDVDHKDHCALMCEAHDTCVYFSYSDSDGKCKLNDDCDINDHMNDYNVYMIGATPSPTAAPTPAPPPTYEPTPMPTPLPVYAMIHEGGLCKQGTWVDVDHKDHCASCAKLMTHASTSATLTRTGNAS
ncbi:unnamed protein product [Prorocentrum cordatum]|uniref:Apple domain-containing protein n=1 Tax=Prorocentrum cordatum TaxID=2364126 RepID=A0ABN9UTH6_9DINO|nr:unnamed protein product [Polarella glacialis]